jgi:uncharacterized membrane protein
LKVIEYWVGGHVSAVLWSPVQQYCGWLNAKHALLQAITVPSEPFTAKLGSQTALIIDSYYLSLSFYLDRSLIIILLTHFIRF